jgi:hypothetical protein
MKISRNAATMNGKFELSSNDYDESNLNRPHSVLGAGVVAEDSIRRNEFRMDASLRAASSEWNDRASFPKRLMRPAPACGSVDPSASASPGDLHPDGSPVGKLTFIRLRPCRKAQNPLRENGDLPSRFNVIWVVQPRFQKYSA